MKFVFGIVGLLFCAAGLIAALNHNDWCVVYICGGLTFTTLGNIVA